MKQSWWIYMIECRGGKIYTGITKNVAERYSKHVRGLGAKYTRINPPVRLLAQKEYESHSEAAQMEYSLKQLTSEKKRLWIQTVHSGL